jgi:hypothetical protein
MSSPIVYLKPLALEDRLVIDTVTRDYEGVGSTWIVFEDEKTVRLMVPPRIRMTPERLAKLKEQQQGQPV